MVSVSAEKIGSARRGLANPRQYPVGFANPTGASWAKNLFGNRFLTTSMKNRGFFDSVMKNHSVTFRAVILALLLFPFNSFWIMQIELVWYSGHPTCASLYYNAVFILFVLICLNLLIKRVYPKTAFTQGELLTVYVMLCIGSSITSHDMLQILIPSIPHAFWYATPENDWANLFARYLPSWLSISDKSAVRGYYEGDSTLYVTEHIMAWLAPMLWWTAFIVVLLFIMVCLNILVRKQWTEHEKLSYPIIQLPLAITEKGGASGIFKNRMMWFGFAIAAGIDLMNGLNFFIPTIPLIKLKCSQYNLGTYFVNKPWNAVGWLPLSFYPFAVGLSFFLPLDLSFSIWFFYLFRKAQQVFGSAAGFHALPRFPYLNEQSSGAWLGLAVLAIWITRRHLKSVFKHLLGIGKSLDDSDEPLPYRLAFLGLIVGGIFLLVFCLRAGMSVWAIITFFILYFSISTAITRMRAELGPPTHELTPMNAAHVMVDVFGVRRIGVPNLTMMSFFWFFNRTYRNHPMPHQLEAFKMAERTKMNNRKLVFAMVIASIVAVPVSFWALLHMSYKVYGAPGGGFAWETFNRLQNRLSAPSSTNPAAVAFLIGGVLFTFLLMAMRMRFLWWPLHPAGYALSMNFGIDYIWFCLVISSAAKAIILRYGGINAHRKTVPFFLGLILGEFTVGSFWSMLSVILQMRTYTFWIF